MITSLILQGMWVLNTLDVLSTELSVLYDLKLNIIYCCGYGAFVNFVLYRLPLVHRADYEFYNMMTGFCLTCTTFDACQMFRELVL